MKIKGLCDKWSMCLNGGKCKVTHFWRILKDMNMGIYVHGGSSGLNFKQRNRRLWVDKIISNLIFYILTTIKFSIVVKNNGIFLPAFDIGNDKTVNCGLFVFFQNRHIILISSWQIKFSINIKIKHLKFKIKQQIITWKTELTKILKNIMLQWKVHHGRVFPLSWILFIHKFKIIRVNWNDIII